MKKCFLILLLITLFLAVSSCKTQEVPGRRRAPRNCNTCTKWSYAPETLPENTLLTNDEA